MKPAFQHANAITEHHVRKRLANQKKIAAERSKFPPVEMADEHGMLLHGGELTVAWLLEAYESGVFPWPSMDGQREVLTWWSPDPRAVIDWDDFHVSRRLKRRIARREFLLTCNQAFDQVIAGCAQPRCDAGGVWITESMARAYQQLHVLGCAHSIEAWQEKQLVGGVYGVALGGMFAAESMFHRVRDASKVALAALVSHLRQRGFVLLDIQIPTEHTQRLGATTIPRTEFLHRLSNAIVLPVSFGDHLCPLWNQPPKT